MPAMTPARRDYYDVLGVDRGAGPDAIRKAFRSQARRLHPDVSAAPDAEDRFRELAEAYSVLARASSRLLYDRLGYRGRGHGGFTPFARHARRRAEAEARAAAGLAAEVRVGFFEAARGTTATARLTGPVACRACAGRGEGPGEPQPCPSCDGTGRLRRTSSAEFGRLLQIERCDRCRGRGRVVPPCTACGGSGQVELKGHVLVTVPPATRDGGRIPLAEGGEVVVRVLPPPAEHRAIRLAAAAGLALAVGLLALVLLS
jgi:molecular chaperone DnaJ